MVIPRIQLCFQIHHYISRVKKRAQLRQSHRALSLKELTTAAWQSCNQSQHQVPLMSGKESSTYQIEASSFFFFNQACTSRRTGENM